jgi:hypothetical protein
MTKRLASPTFLRRLVCLQRGRFVRIARPAGGFCKELIVALKVVGAILLLGTPPPPPEEAHLGKDRPIVSIKIGSIFESGTADGPRRLPHGGNGHVQSLADVGGRLPGDIAWRI